MCIHSVYLPDGVDIDQFVQSWDDDVNDDQDESFEFSPQCADSEE